METWIPVTKQVPDDFARVLIWWMNLDTNECGYGFGYQVDDVWYGDARGLDRKVLAWMPLPLPPNVREVNYGTGKQAEER